MADRISTAVLVHGARADGSSRGSVIGSLHEAFAHAFAANAQDRMILEETQPLMAPRMKATVVSHPVGHVPNLTARQRVVDIILAAVRAVEGERA